MTTPKSAAKKPSAAKNPSAAKKNTEYEKFVRDIVQTLVRAEGLETVTVEHDKQVQGLSRSHQIDVYGSTGSAASSTASSSIANATKTPLKSTTCWH